MIQIDLKKKSTCMNGSLSEITTEFILLTHSFIDSVLPRMNKEARETFKCAIATAFMEELGMETLQKGGFVGEVVKVDLSKPKKEDGNETDR